MPAITDSNPRHPCDRGTGRRERRVRAVCSKRGPLRPRKECGPHETTMGSWLTVWIALVSALVLAVAMSAGGAGAATQALASQWTDAAGDAQGGAPDLTAVQVTNDAAGTITTTVTAPMVAGTSMMMVLDTNMDRNPEYGIVAKGIGSGVVSPLAISVASGGAASIPSLHMSSTTTTVTFSFAKTDLGVDDAFIFYVATMTDAQLSSGQFGDAMPDGNAAYMYVLTASPPPTPAPTPTPTPVAVKPMIAAPVTTPKVAVAGKQFTITFNVTRSDNGGPLTSGKMVLDPLVAGKLARHAESFKGGTAKATFAVPKAAKSKQLKVKLTITTGTQSATKVVMFRVK